MPVAPPVLFTSEARADVIAAQDWYEEQSPGLGAQFREQLNHTVERIADNSRQFPLVYRDLRRALLRRFPYSVFFRLEPEAIVVIACFHAGRDPRQWQQRAGH